MKKELIVAPRAGLVYHDEASTAQVWGTLHITSTTRIQQAVTAS